MKGNWMISKINKVNNFSYLFAFLKYYIFNFIFTKPQNFLLFLTIYVSDQKSQFREVFLYLFAQSQPTICDSMDCSSFVQGDSPGKNTGVGCHEVFFLCNKNVHPNSSGSCGALLFTLQQMSLTYTMDTVRLMKIKDPWGQQAPLVYVCHDVCADLEQYLEHRKHITLNQ